MKNGTTRRELFARLRGGADQIRPPWSRGEGAFVDLCTRCGRCAEACPVEIVVKGHGGFPTVDFARGGCTLCHACVDACRDGCFDRSAPEPWLLRAAIGDACVEERGVTCRMCEEACEARAIRFTPRRGGGSTASVCAEVCTGCGVCVQVCPVRAIAVTLPAPTAEIAS